MTTPSIESRLSRAEQLLASTAEQTVANIEAIAVMREAIVNLQMLSSESRADMANLADWAGQVTEAIAEGRQIQQQLANVQVSLAAGQERQEAILMELIRQQGNFNGSA